jgi:hypothetical protein
MAMAAVHTNHLAFPYGATSGIASARTSALKAAPLITPMPMGRALSDAVPEAERGLRDPADSLDDRSASLWRSDQGEHGFVDQTRGD